MKPKHFSYRRSVSFLIATTLFLSACGQVSSPVSPTSTLASTESVPAWLQIYFTDPTAPHAMDYEGGPDEDLVAAIDAARLSVDMAAYSLNLWSIRDALLQAQRRGVTVQLVMESDNMDESEVQELIEAGIPVVGDQQEGLMHDKFVIIDRSEVWVGSMNYTVGGTYKDNNNLIRIRSSQVAEDYLVEFEEMFAEGLFGPYVLPANPHPKLALDGTPVEVYFSPDDGVAARLLELIHAAQESIFFMAFSFTANDLGEAIIEQAREGVTVAGVMDEGQVASNQGTEYDAFQQAGLDVRLDGNDGLMHHKVMIIDRQIVVTGSYNFTASAEENNDENLVILFSPEAATQYLQEFDRVYAQAQ